MKTPRTADETAPPPSPGEPSTMLGPIHAFGSGCFYVFALIYLIFVHSWYMFLSNAVFGTLGILSWFALRAAYRPATRSAVFLTVVYLGLVNVAVHLGEHPLPMVFWGMSISIAAAFMFEVPGVLTWVGLSLGFYPLVQWLKQGPLAQRVIALDDFQYNLLTVATYAALLVFIAFSFVHFRRRLEQALGGWKAQSDALRASESLLAESQRIGRIGSFEVDLRTGSWTGSSVLQEILGVSPQGSPNALSAATLVHPDSQDAFQQLLRQQLANGSAFEQVFRLSQPDGAKELWVHGRAAVYRDDTGTPLRIVGTLQDVSQVRRDQDEQQRMQHRLFAAQKLESLGVLAGGIAHDFNNLLTGILGNATLARMQRDSLPPQMTEVLQNIETAAQRAADLTRQMLDFSGKGQLVAAPFNINHALTETTELIRASIPKSVALEFRLCDPGPIVLADASQMRQVFMNLILNGAEAIGDRGGVVAVTTGICAGEQGARLASIEVADTGCGMDEPTRTRMFDPFFSTKFTGRGLGLAAVLGIVQQHHGAIHVESAPGQGTKILVHLPCAAEASTAASISDTPSPSRPTYPGRVVLVADDEEAVRTVARLALEGMGLTVLEAEDGDIALTMVRDHVPPPELVLLDLTMPRMSGAETFAELRRLRPTLPVLLMSGYSRHSAALRLGESRPDGFLEKPFSAQVLLDTVSHHLKP